MGVSKSEQKNRRLLEPLISQDQMISGLNKNARLCMKSDLTCTPIKCTSV